MGTIRHHFKHSVAAVSLIVTFSLPFGVRADETGDLLQQLQQADAAEAARIEREIARSWSKSGSAAMDLLLKRGRDALDIDNLEAAIEHLTALTDHAPEFAEGFHTRAMAYFKADLIGPALGDLERVLELNPQHFGAIRGLAVVFETLGDETRAYEAYEMVLRLHPHDEEAQKGVERLRTGVQGQEL
ncbi:hypothetical protein PGB28_01750 [Primorskyibacter aestuariivivens]|uniref:tetratricopeptide repeat protein n=1 Tax=Primorskyibacter aestuariivivens TaxID=1888912 RepID=UPI002300434E|nr:hypothetical protein [Primorskyibacter aestuariivivens]MDA7427165.1 hypothetical protein [Primorskyibacter aestuariivivens]